MTSQQPRGRADLDLGRSGGSADWTPPDPLLTAVDAPAAVGLGGPPSLAERVAAAFLVSYRPATRIEYRTSLGRWAAWCAGLGVDVFQVDTSHVERWIHQLEEEGVASGTIRRHLAALHGFYQKAVEMRVSLHDPTVGARRPPRRRGSSGPILDREQAEQLLAGIHGKGDEALVCLLLLNGLHIAEVLALNVRDVAKVRGQPVARVVRTGGAREVALASRTYEALSRLIHSRAAWTLCRRPLDPNALFLNRRSGRRLDRREAAARVRCAAQRAGLDIPVTPLMLRRTFITLALDAGASLREVREAVGHADHRATRRYRRGRRDGGGELVPPPVSSTAG